MKKIFILVLFLLTGAIAFTIEPTISNSINMKINELQNISATSRDYRVFYNLGVLYLNKNDVGRAILNLKRAYLLNPYNKDVYSVLTDTRTKLGVPAYIFEATFLEKAILFPFTIFHINATIAIGVVFFMLGSVLLSLELSGQIAKISLFKKIKIRRVAIIFFAIGVVYLIAGTIRHSFVFNSKMAVVVGTSQSDDIALFQLPEDKSEPIDTTSIGMECQIEDEQSAFLRINTIDGKVGWIDKMYVERLW